MITGLDHITINVKSIDVSIKFYKDVIGLEECGTVDMGDHTLYYFQLPQGVRLELIDYENKLEHIHPSELTPGIYRHFCLVTDDVEEIAKRCKDNGTKMHQDVAYVEKLKFKNILIEDPNGVEIEIIQNV
ncbi:MAG: VOC family protein [Lachnospiraceae bacterium]|nr:VOC family protein [Lachnospiraceae bacterium]